MLTKLYDAPTAFKCLNGIIGVFKPVGKTNRQIRNTILHKICVGLNELEVRKPRKMLSLCPGGVHGQILKNVLDLSDDILAVGPRYQICDIKCKSVANLGTNTSGVLLFGINSGISIANHVQKGRILRCYHVTGKLGVATENYLSNSIITDRATHTHISANRLSSLVASLQASNQRKMYELCGVDIQSQTAYELACQGLIRPLNNTQPVIYGIRVVEFRRPYFTLEIHAINETESYLAALIHDIGIELKSVAHCSALRCIQHGPFTVQHTLLRKDWNLQKIFDSMLENKKILELNPSLIDQTEIKIMEDLNKSDIKFIE